MTRTTAAPRTPAAAIVALALAASASVGALPASGAAAPLERVVVTGTDAAAAVLRAGGRVLDPLPLVGGVGALLPSGADLPAPLRVTPDRPLRVQSAGPAPAGPVSTVRDTLGVGAPKGEGAGVRVAVVDTGIADAADLGRVEPLAVDGVGTGDGLGHGTFIAGLIAGTGASSGGRAAGVAPGATLLDVKVADAEGDTGLLDVLRGLQKAQAAGADVVNLSLSSESPLPPALDPLTVALERLWADGVVVVVPSGNDPAAVSSPGDSSVLLTVGGLAEAGTADRRDDSVAAWSGRRGGKPELVAPGQSLLSLVAAGSAAEAAQKGRTDVPAGYGVGSGTSFATAVTSGAAAALLAERPHLTPDQVKALLTGTAYRGSDLGRKDGAGAGGLDLARALTAPDPKVSKRPVDAGLPATDLATWEVFVEAMLTGDAAAAASSWSKLSPQARHWVARHWIGLDEESRSWEARHWIARHWIVEGWSEQDWLARHWIARHWAARHWADADWSARHWAARHWSARHWSGDSWSARHWSARQWSARQWSATAWR